MSYTLFPDSVKSARALVKESVNFLKEDARIEISLDPSSRSKESSLARRIRELAFGSSSTIWNPDFLPPADLLYMDTTLTVGRIFLDYTFCCAHLARFFSASKEDYNKGPGAVFGAIIVGTLLTMFVMVSGAIVFGLVKVIRATSWLKQCIKRHKECKAQLRKELRGTYQKLLEERSSIRGSDRVPSFDEGQLRRKVSALLGLNALALSEKALSTRLSHEKIALVSRIILALGFVSCLIGLVIGCVFLGPGFSVLGAVMIGCHVGGFVGMLCGVIGALVAAVKQFKSRREVCFAIQRAELSSLFSRLIAENRYSKNIDPHGCLQNVLEQCLCALGRLETESRCLNSSEIKALIADVSRLCENPKSLETTDRWSDSAVSDVDYN